MICEEMNKEHIILAINGFVYNSNLKKKTFFGKI